MAGVDSVTAISPAKALLLFFKVWSVGINSVPFELCFNSFYPDGWRDLFGEIAVVQKAGRDIFKQDAYECKIVVKILI